MSDLLSDAALSFSKSLEYDYLFKLGNKKRKILLSVISNNKSEFTHIMGLDHLDDIPVITGNNSRQKEAIFEKILKGKIIFEDIKGSQNLNRHIKGSFNYYTNKPYTIAERLTSLQDFESILNSSYNGSIRRWNSSQCKAVLPNGSPRKVKIPADFLLTVPSKERAKENYYFFLYQTNKNAPNSEPIKLSIFSAFPDCVDLTRGQECPFTILQLEKLNIRTNQKEEVYIRPSYKAELIKENQNKDSLIEVKSEEQYPTKAYFSRESLKKSAQNLKSKEKSSPQKAHNHEKKHNNEIE